MTLTNKSYAACIAGNVCFITSLFVEITEKHQMIDLIVNVVVLENIFQYSAYDVLQHLHNALLMSMKTAH